MPGTVGCAASDRPVKLQSTKQRRSSLYTASYFMRWCQEGERQGCARHILFFGLIRLWLMWQSRKFNSNSTPNFTFLDWPNSESTQIRNILTWLDSESLVKSDPWLITYFTYRIWPKVVLTWGDGRICGWMYYVTVDRFFPCNATDKCKILPFSLQKNQWLNFDTSSRNPVDSTLTQMAICVIRLRLDSYSWFSRPTQLWLD